MAKHILSGVEGFAKRGREIFLVDPSFVKVVSGWNHRTDFSGEEELVASIKENGVKTPLKVKKTKDGILNLVAGERRLRAVLRAIKEGACIKSIPVEVAQMTESDIDLYIDSIIENDSKPPTPSEEASSFRRLILWGLSIREIALKVGRSDTHIRNRLELAKATPEVKKALDSGEITVKDAKDIIAESDGNVDAQSAALEKKKAETRAIKRKTLNLFFQDGDVKYSGTKDVSCDHLKELIQTDYFKNKLSAAGFEPESIRITLLLKGESDG